MGCRAGPCPLLDMHFGDGTQPEGKERADRGLVGERLRDDATAVGGAPVRIGDHQPLQITVARLAVEMDDFLAG